MKNIAAYALMTGTMMGLLPQSALASHPVPSVMGVDLKTGNGSPDPDFPGFRLSFGNSCSEPSSHL
jgi:hypothetical protein